MGELGYGTEVYKGFEVRGELKVYTELEGVG
jgi:hypothetical protein